MDCHDPLTHFYIVFSFTYGLFFVVRLAHMLCEMDVYEKTWEDFYMLKLWKKKKFVVPFVTVALLISAVLTFIGLAINWNLFLVWGIIGALLVAFFLITLIDLPYLIPKLFQVTYKFVDKKLSPYFEEKEK